VTTTVTVVLLPGSCAPNPASVPAGAVIFNVTNQGADAVSELELKRGEQTVAEKENLTPGLSGSFTAQLDPGTYALECPGATTAESEFRVTE
jgi:iron uptake system component EfeO